jgi:hypothetical protein
MFLRMKERFEAVMDLVDDILAADPEPAPSHPHDRTVSLRIERRGGSVTLRDMHCLCPVRPASDRRGARALAADAARDVHDA